MTRVKRGTISVKRRRRVLKLTKGYRWDRKSKERAAHEALLHALPRMFRGRKEKKRTMRALWQVKISASTKEMGMSYSRFIAALKKANIALDRKVLADLAEHEPKVFAKVMEMVK